MKIEECTRCGSKIIDRHFAVDRHKIFSHKEENGYKTQEALLCSTCENELWEWVFGDDTPDRTDKADPIPLERMSDGIEREVERLEGVLDGLGELIEEDAGR